MLWALFAFVPHCSRSVGVPLGSARYPHLPALRNNDSKCDNCPIMKTTRKKVLLISFAGSTFLVGGFPRAEFQAVLEKTAERCGVTGDCLSLVDPSVTFYAKSSSDTRRRRRNSSKWEGWDEVVENINQLIAREHYDKVIAVGSSMGATAILALVGRFQCDTAIVFNPLVDLVQESRLGFGWADSDCLAPSVPTCQASWPNSVSTARQMW